MASSAITLQYTATGSFARTLRLYLRETRFELIRTLRNRMVVASTLGFPALFYLLFGVVNKNQTMQGNINVAKYLLGGYAVFGMLGAALFGIGIGLAMDRTSGWLELKRASPMPPLAGIVARCIVAVIASLTIVTMLCGLGIGLAGVHLQWAEYGRMLLVTAIGSVPFAALGLLFAALLPANAAPGAVNLIYLPMSYCSGLWVPFAFLPHWVQHIAYALPTYHLAQLMLEAIGYGQPGQSVLLHLVALLAFTAILLGAAAVAHGRAEADA